MAGEQRRAARSSDGSASVARGNSQKRSEMAAATLVVSIKTSLPPTSYNRLKVSRAGTILEKDCLRANDSVVTSVSKRFFSDIALVGRGAHNRLNSRGFEFATGSGVRPLLRCG